MRRVLAVLALCLAGTLEPSSEAVGDPSKGPFEGFEGCSFTDSIAFVVKIDKDGRIKGDAGLECERVPGSHVAGEISSVSTIDGISYADFSLTYQFAVEGGGTHSNYLHGVLTRLPDDDRLLVFDSHRFFDWYLEPK
jgi:hypothetical protein